MTQDQLLASDPMRSVWVSASAGTGKTKVLTDRVLRLLLTGERPGAILCITFTKAAAAEMLERIERELGKWAVADDDALRQLLITLTGGEVNEAVLQRARRLFASVMDAPDKLRVQTIHSFCQSMIARFPIEAGVPAHVKILDEYDAHEMLNDARLRLFTESGRDEKTSEVLRSLARTIAESTLQEVLKTIVGARRKFTPLLNMQGGEERFSVLLHEMLNMPLGMNITKLMSQYFSYSPEELSALKHAVALLSTVGGKTNLALAETMATWLEKREDVEAYAQSFYTGEGKIRAKLYTKEVADTHPAIIELIAREIQRVEGVTQSVKTLRVIDSTKQMMLLAKIVLGHYAEEKTKHGVMDYDDLISHTVQLFKASNAASWVLYKLDSSINHLLVDEAQDTSEQQWQIVEALAEEFFAGEGARNLNRTLFVVGDEKQSIFSFQGADPNLFDRLRLTLSKKVRDAGKDFSHVRLDTSFRSTQAVLSVVDNVFAAPQARDGLVFSESIISHTAHRKNAPGRVELWPLIETPKKEKQTIWDSLEQAEYIPSAEQKMAETIAQEIAGWLTQKRMLPSQGRPVQPGDIMILLRRRGRFAQNMIRCLKRQGVAVAGSDRLLITDHIAVMDCMALADFLLQPEDDLTLATVLKSPFIGLSEEALFELAYGRGKISLWHRLKHNPAYTQATQFLSEMLARTDYMPPYELFSHALVTLGKRKAIAARLGKEADDPLNEFLSLALHYEQSHPPSLQGFMHWIKNNETEIKRDMEKGRNEVRILTVHASKGLQAPIVFLPDTTSLPKHPDNLQWMQGDFTLPLWSAFSECDDRHLLRLKEMAREDALKEYRRLLYVAMTRAQDEMIICGWKGDKALPQGCWYELISNSVSDNTAWQTLGDKKVMTSGEYNGSSMASEVEAIVQPTLPAWASMPAQPEPKPSKPLSPSQQADNPPSLTPNALQAARARGVLIHRLLQFLPQHTVNERNIVMQKFMLHYGAELNERERNDIAKQVLSVLNDAEFSEVFSTHSQAEVPVVGVVEDEKGNPITIAGQIDRLVVQGDVVMIVDFKTGMAVPKTNDAIPAAYKRQLYLYKQLIQKIYPDKTVRCAILWTSAPMLMPIDGIIAA